MSPIAQAALIHTRFLIPSPSGTIIICTTQDYALSLLVAGPVTIDSYLFSILVQAF